MKLSIAFTVDSVEFTPAVIAGDASLGGSESACLGLARALQARGHAVHIFTTQLHQDAPRVDQAGVQWHRAESIAQWSVFMDWDVVIALRQPNLMTQAPAKFRVLWCQDLMAGDAMKHYVMSLAWHYDAVAYVSKYHQQQWEALVPELKGIGWATKNGHDAELAKQARKTAVKNPNQIIHISRPERGLTPLLKWWPALKAAYPAATLAVCRYSSMYDKDGWGEICRRFDEQVDLVNAQVGGIVRLGELGKPDLYKAIAESAVMWYPGVSTFGETSCIAAIEAQACGTPFVGSYKGALPETVPSGVLVKGVAESDEAYGAEAVAAVSAMLDGCARATVAYRDAVKAGVEHVRSYSYAAIAEEWERWLVSQFHARYTREKAGVLRRLQHEDDYVTARLVAEELGDTAAMADAADVMTGEIVTPAVYAQHALDPVAELQQGNERLRAVLQQFVGCKNIIDVACGSGAYPIALALADADRHVTAVDYAQGNIDVGKAAAEQYGVADRITWVCASAWDLRESVASDWLVAHLQTHAGTYDGLWCGEFIEHVVDCTGLVSTLDQLVKHQGRVAYTCPSGPMHSIATRTMETHRTHVHHFRARDLAELFGAKEAYTLKAAPVDVRNGRGEFVGHWFVSYRRGLTNDTGARPLDRRILTRPYDRLSFGLIVNDTLDLRRCLDSIWAVADEIVIGNTGADPALMAGVLAEFPRKVRVIDVPPVDQLPGGFSEARNRVLAETTGEWFAWIDADEILCGASDLGKYLDAMVYIGFAIAQNHLHLDAPMGTDRPVRVFRKRADIQFYGCVHEQPQMGDCNGDVIPSLQVGDVQIAHTGYLHEGVRRAKALTRNLPLLVRDQEQFPERELGKLLVLRDYANLALWMREQSGGAITPQVGEYYGNVISLFETHFSEPGHRFYALAKPFYEQALSQLPSAMHVEIAVAAQPGGLTAPATPMRLWVRSTEQLRKVLAHQLDGMLAPMEHPQTMDVEPLAVDTEALPLLEVSA